MAGHQILANGHYRRCTIDLRYGGWVWDIAFVRLVPRLDVPQELFNLGKGFDLNLGLGFGPWCWHWSASTNFQFTASHGPFGSVYPTLKIRNTLSAFFLGLTGSTELDGQHAQTRGVGEHTGCAPVPSRFRRLQGQSRPLHFSKLLAQARLDNPRLSTAVF
jgi:hypothetical protein